jgi:hypothetical protein
MLNLLYEKNVCSAAFFVLSKFAKLIVRYCFLKIDNKKEKE